MRTCAVALAAVVAGLVFAPSAEAGGYGGYGYGGYYGGHHGGYHGSYYGGHHRRGYGRVGYYSYYPRPIYAPPRVVYSRRVVVHRSYYGGYGGWGHRGRGHGGWGGGRGGGGWGHHVSHY